MNGSKIKNKIDLKQSGFCIGYEKRDAKKWILGAKTKALVFIFRCQQQLGFKRK